MPLSQHQGHSHSGRGQSRGQSTPLLALWDPTMDASGAPGLLSTLGQGQGGTPHKLGCVFSLRHSFLWFEEGRFQISPISSENSFNTTTLPQQQLQSFIGVFPIHEGRGGQDDIIDQLLINSLVFFFFFSFQENHSHPPIAWFRRKQDGRRAVC